MMKPIFKLSAIFIVLLLLPVLVMNRVELDLGKFVTEYYKFVINIFVISLIAAWYKKSIDDLQENRARERQYSDLQQKLSGIYIGINGGGVSAREITAVWRDCLPFVIHKYEASQIKKLTRFTNNLTEENLRFKIDLPEYKELTDIFTDLLKANP